MISELKGALFQKIAGYFLHIFARALTDSALYSLRLSRSVREIEYCLILCPMRPSYAAYRSFPALTLWSR